VGNGVKAALNGILNGSIDTLLDSGGNFTPAVRQPYAIAGLAINGTVEGSIQAGAKHQQCDLYGPKDRSGKSGSYRKHSRRELGRQHQSRWWWHYADPVICPAVGQAGGSISTLMLPRGLGGAIEAGTAAMVSWALVERVAALPK